MSMSRPPIPFTAHCWRETAQLDQLAPYFCAGSLSHVGPPPLPTHPAELDWRALLEAENSQSVLASP